MIVPDNEIESFRRIDEDKINDTNRDFVEKIPDIMIIGEIGNPRHHSNISKRCY